MMSCELVVLALTAVLIACCDGNGAEARADMNPGMTGIPLQMLLASPKETGSSGLNCERDGYFINSFNASQIVVRNEMHAIAVE